MVYGVIASWCENEGIRISQQRDLQSLPKYSHWIPELRARTVVVLTYVQLEMRLEECTGTYYYVNSGVQALHSRLRTK